jgi:predicted enzyme related to lactoylglutathione lyase
MEVQSYEHGVPAWVDLGTPDVAGASAFYGALFGWQIPEATEETGGYAVAMYKDQAVAGIGPAQNPGPPYWTTYVAVDDADAIPAKVTKAGGAVYAEPFDVFDVGRMGVFADPTGAAFSVWQAKSMIGCGLVNEPNTYGWSELLTADVDGAKAFYASVLGWGAETHGEGAGAYTEWKLSGRSIGGMMARPAEMPAEVPDCWNVYFCVDDCDAVVARVQELGGQLLMGPMDIEPGRFAMVADPQGGTFNVMRLDDPPT